MQIINLTPTSLYLSKEALAGKTGFQLPPKQFTPPLPTDILFAPHFRRLLDKGTVGIRLSEDERSYLAKVQQLAAVEHVVAPAQAPKKLKEILAPPAQPKAQPSPTVPKHHSAKTAHSGAPVVLDGPNLKPSEASITAIGLGNPVTPINAQPTPSSTLKSHATKPSEAVPTQPELGANARYVLNASKP